ERYRLQRALAAGDGVPHHPRAEGRERRVVPDADEVEERGGEVEVPDQLRSRRPEVLLLLGRERAGRRVDPARDVDLLVVDRARVPELPVLAEGLAVVRGVD